MKPAKHLLIVFAALLCSFTVSAHDFAKNGIFYKVPKQIDLADLTVMVTYFDPDNDSGYSTFKNEYRGRVVIPSTVTYEGMTFRVTRIGDHAFYDCDALTSVVIPSTIESIGYLAFAGCSNLASITIPKSVTRIEENAFRDCSSLTSITLTEGLKSIGYCAFRGCVSLTSIKIPNSVAEFECFLGDSRTFEGCSNLTSITIPESVTSIGNHAFKGCNKLVSVKCPERFKHLFPKVDFSTQVGDFKFENGVLVAYVGSSSNVVLPKSFKGQKYSIGSGAFKNSAITSITIPEGVTRIGSSAFESCKSLSSIAIPTSATNIADFVFLGCSSLTFITIPKGVTSIGAGAFSGCTSLTSIILPESVTSIEGGAFSNCSSLTDITIPESVTSIGNHAFLNCNSLTSITLPESVTWIGDDAFKGCNKLTSVKCPARFKSSFPNVDFSVRVGDFKFEDGVLVGYVGNSSNVVLPNSFKGQKYSIGSGAFKDSRITSVVIPEGVTSIGESAFYDCSNLTSITLPESVTWIGDDAFKGCNKLASVKCPKRLRNSFPDVDFSVRVGDFKFEDGVLVGYVGSSRNVVLPNDFKGQKYAIGSGAFKNSAVTSITIPEGVTSIRVDAFFGCNSLTSITIPKSVLSIEYCAFAYCSSLKSITIPKNVTKIEDLAFYSCSNLKTVKVHQSWKSALEKRKGVVFKDCPKVKIRYVK